jgi:hypothetical protein
MEHRWGERSKLNIPVQVDCASRGVVLAVMRDASASGGFLCTAAQLPLLASVRVLLGTAAMAGHPPGIDALVVRRAPDGFGLEWLELAPPEVLAVLSAAHAAAPIQPSAPEPPAQPIVVAPRPAPARNLGKRAVR